MWCPIDELRAAEKILFEASFGETVTRTRLGHAPIRPWTSTPIVVHRTARNIVERLDCGLEKRLKRASRNRSALPGR